MVAGVEEVYFSIFVNIYFYVLAKMNKYLSTFANVFFLLHSS